MDLLDDVGEVEVGGEGAHEPGRVVLVDGAQQLVRRRRIVTTEGADLLDEVEQLLALLAHEALTEQRRDPAHVGAQRGVGVAFLPVHLSRIALRSTAVLGDCGISVRNATSPSARPSCAPETDWRPLS